MKHLKAFKENAKISMLVIGHTPKRDKTLPITDNDLAGSKMLSNLADSSFTIGDSARDAKLRYIKLR